jgi:thiol-disulfide isomerase/thioredoxin
MRAWCLAAVTALFLAGCEANSGKPAATKAKTGPEVELTEATAAAIDRAVRESKGSVVLVDFWATWCGPCVERFPHLIALDKKYADLGLVCISVSIDFPNKTEAALQFLVEQRATFRNFHVTDRETPEGNRTLAERFGLGPAIPFMAVFGRDGQRVWAGNGSQMSPPGLDALISREIDRRSSSGGR